MINKALLLLCLISTLSGVQFSDYGDDWDTRMSSKTKQFLALKILQERLWDTAGETNRKYKLWATHRIDNGIRLISYPICANTYYEASHFSTMFGGVSLFPGSNLPFEKREAAVRELLKSTGAYIIPKDGNARSPKRIHEIAQVTPQIPLPRSSNLGVGAPSDNFEIRWQQKEASEKAEKKAAALWKSLSADYATSSGVFTKPA